MNTVEGHIYQDDKKCDTAGIQIKGNARNCGEDLIGRPCPLNSIFFVINFDRFLYVSYFGKHNISYINFNSIIYYFKTVELR